MEIDNKTAQYFSNVKQVFLYLSDKCNLLCEQCLYKPNVVYEKEIAFETAKELLYTFKQLGAFKLTVLGGEVSLYDHENNSAKLILLLEYARAIGYQYIRIDTNGQRRVFFQNNAVFRNIDEVSFSIDGYNSETNDCLRGRGTFSRAIESLKLLQNSNRNLSINITTCVTKQNVRIAGGIENFLNHMIAYATEIGISQLNFHGVFKMGVPMDAWTGDSHLNPIEWYYETQNIAQNVKAGNYHIDVRFPVHIVKRDEFNKHPKYYGYCPCKLGERALIHPDGIIRVCSSMLSTPYGVAHYNDNQITWNSFNNEIVKHEINEYTPCTNQTELYTGDFCPICFSIKPYQREIIWDTSHVEMLRSNE